MKQSFKSINFIKKESRIFPKLTVFITLTVDICKCHDNDNNGVYTKIT